MTHSLFDLFLKTQNICTDTRKNCKNSIFIALSGLNFDGNCFAAKALEMGALWAVVDKDSAGSNERFIRVENTLKTLQNLANQYVNYLNIPIIAITGSNGKTTTKELLHRCLSTRWNAHASLSNFNNHIGLPISILSAPLHTEIMVLEMGDNRPGDIAELCAIAQPSHGFITNIGKDHLEGYGSMQANAATKAELFDYLNQHAGVCFFLDEEVEKLAKGKKVNLNNLEINSLEGQEKLVFEFGGKHYPTQLIGEFNIHNIKAALGISAFFGCDMQAACNAICSYQPENMRSQLIEKGSKSIFLDAYNANPSSVLAALESFDKIKTQKAKIAILGDMAELGAISEEEHQYITNWFSNKKIIGLLIGENFAKCVPNANTELLRSKEMLKGHPKLAQQDIYFLLKASRSMALESVLDWL